MNQFDLYDIVQNQITKPLFTPLLTGSPAIIEEDGTPLTEQDITDLLFDCSTDSVNVQAEDRMKEIFKQTLTYYSKKLNVQNVYAVQAGLKEHMPLPTSRCKYIPTDVIDASKQLMSGQISQDAFFCNSCFLHKSRNFWILFR